MKKVSVPDTGIGVFFYPWNRDKFFPDPTIISWSFVTIKNA
jgi:hypothetical protein